MRGVVRSLIVLTAVRKACALAGSLLQGFEGGVADAGVGV